MQSDIARRQAAMATLVNATDAEIKGLLVAFDLPPCENLREPEQGLVMVRGRIGGDGAPFNLGEATITRAAVRLGSGEVGMGHTLGRSRAKAEMIALCDAMMQSDRYRNTIETKVLAPLRERMTASRRQRAEQTAATRVNFYTLVRGEG